jgi:hypothetical protein
MDFKDVSQFEDGHLSDEAAGLYIDALLNKELTDLHPEIRTHVQDCPECKDKILEIYSFLNSTTKIENTIPMPGFLEEVAMQPKERMFPAYLKRMAAVFFVTAVFLGAYFLVFQNSSVFQTATPDPDHSRQRAGVVESAQQNQTGIIKKTATPKDDEHLPQIKKATSERIKKDFKVNRNLEYMVDSNFRSTSIEVLTPENGSTLERGIRFCWKALAANPLVLKILNNQNEILYSYRVQAGQGQTVFEFNERLKPGLYYWKLERGHDLAHVGKFFVRRSLTSPTE